MNTFSRLALVFTFVGSVACGTSEEGVVDPVGEPSYPPASVTGYRLRLQEIRDASGAPLDLRLVPLSFALKVEASGTTRLPRVELSNGVVGGELTWRGDTSLELASRSIGWSGAPVFGAIDSVENVTRFEVGAGTIALGDTWSAQGELIRGAGSPQTARLAFVVEADTPAVVQLAPGSTLGGRYLSWIAPPRLTLDKPLTFLSAVRVQRSGGAANDLGTDLAALTSTPLPVPLGKSVLSIPAATDWLGITREAQQISYEVVESAAVGAIDFNDGDADVLLSTGSAVRADADCESARCLVLEGNAQDDCSEEPAAAFHVSDGQATARVRVLAASAEGNRAVNVVSSDGSQRIFNGTLPASGRTDYAFDSGWFDVVSFSGGRAVLMSVVACQPGVKLLVQSVR